MNDNHDDSKKVLQGAAQRKGEKKGGRTLRDPLADALRRNLLRRKQATKSASGQET